MPKPGLLDKFHCLTPFLLAFSGKSDNQIRGDVERHASVTVTAQDIDGNSFSVEKAPSFISRVLQHENDHLDGIMFVDRVSPMKKTLIAPKLKKMARLNKKQ